MSEPSSSISTANLPTVRYIGLEPLPLESAWYDIGILAHQQLIGNSEVLLEADEIDTDDFGRLLRYVYVDRALVNGLLLRNGVALLGEERDGLNRHHVNLQIWSETAKVRKTRTLERRTPAIHTQRRGRELKIPSLARNAASSETTKPRAASRRPKRHRSGFGNPLTRFKVRPRPRLRPTLGHRYIHQHYALAGDRRTRSLRLRSHRNPLS